jgi:hypothetical protein
MDEVLIDVYRTMNSRLPVSVDEILETPELRHQFLDSARKALGAIPERDLLHRLVYLRKRSRLPRSRSLPPV